MKVFYTEEAEKCICDIFDYIAYDNYDNAIAVRNRMKEAIDRLEDFPDSGAYPKHPKLRVRGYRFVVSDNYLVFYKLKSDAVIIMTVIHGSRDYNNLI